MDAQQFISNPQMVRVLVIVCSAIMVTLMSLWCLLSCCCRRVGRTVKRSHLPSRGDGGLPQLCIERRTKSAARPRSASKGVQDGPSPGVSANGKESTRQHSIELRPSQEVTLEAHTAQSVRIGWRVFVPPGYVGCISDDEPRAPGTVQLMVKSCRLHAGWHELTVTVANVSGDAVNLPPEGPPLAFFSLERAVPFTFLECKKEQHTLALKGRPPWYRQAFLKGYVGLLMTFQAFIRAIRSSTACLEWLFQKLMAPLRKAR